MPRKPIRHSTDTSKSLSETLRGSDLVPLSAELAEAALDGVLEDGALKDLPVVGSLLALWNTGRSVRDMLFTRKLMAFLAGVENVSPEDRAAVLTKIAKNPEAAGELLLLALERMDSMEKPELLARTFVLLAEGTITVSDFHALRVVIDMINLADLPEVVKFYNYYTYCPDELMSSLMQTKLCTISKGGIMDGAHRLYGPTAIGKLFLMRVMELTLNPQMFTPEVQARIDREAAEASRTPPGSAP